MLLLSLTLSCPQMMRKRSLFLLQKRRRRSLF
jgi:hypothetical protein